MRTSIVIPSSHRLEQIEPTLNSLGRQSLDRLETILVQNGLSERDSQNETLLYAKYTSRFRLIGLKIIYEDVPGLLSGRHRGADEATGDLLVFVDDDVTFAANWLDELTSVFDDPQTVLAGGPSLPVFETDPPSWMDPYWQSTPLGGRQMAQLSLLELGVNETVEIDADLVWGLNYAIRKKTLIQRGGFHPDCVPSNLQHFQGDGETGLSREIATAGERVVYNPRATVYHHIGRHRMTPEYFEQRSFYQGVCDSYTSIRKHGLSESEQVKGPRAFVEFARRWKRRLFPAAATDPLAARFDAAYHRGFRFHQQAVRASPKLLQWVRRDNYFDYHYPDLEPGFVVPSRKQVV